MLPVLRHLTLNPKPQFTILYLDRFSDTLSAGSFNGTTADIGGARSITDTGSRISSKFGEMNIASGGTQNDPRYALGGGFTRTPGLAMICHFREDQPEATANAIIQIGFDNDSSSALQANRFRFSTSGAIEMANASFFGSYTNIGTYSANTLYSVAVVLLETIAVHLIKGGAWSDWTGLGTLPLHSATTVYPAIAGYNRASSFKSAAVVQLGYPWRTDAIASGLTPLASKMLDDALPLVQHAAYSILSFFPSGTSVGLERSGNDYWIWQDIGNGYRWYVQLYSRSSPSAIHTLHKSQIRSGAVTIDQELYEGGSVWEYAITVSSAFVGNAHGYDTESSLTFTVDGSSVALSDGQSSSGSASVVATRVSTLTNPSGGASIGTATTTYTMTPSGGLTVDVTISWSISVPSSGDVGMMPANDTAAATGFAVHAGAKYYDLTLYSGSNIDYDELSTPAGVGFGTNYAVIARTVDGSNRPMHWQDRGTALNKLYGNISSPTSFSTNYRATKMGTGAFLV